MAQSADIPAWIALFLGLYALAAAIGELRQPGGWAKMLTEIEASAALRYIIGILCLALGAAIYLVTPWRGTGEGSDWLAIAVSVIGGVCAAEGMLFLAAGERFMAFSRRLIGTAGPLWAGLSALIGGALIFTALARI